MKINRTPLLQEIDQEGLSKEETLKLLSEGRDGDVARIAFQVGGAASAETLGQTSLVYSSTN